MSNSQRRDEKKRRREKRLAKRDRAKENLDSILRTLQRQSSFSEPRSWPGAADPSLNRPDRIKFELATFAEKGPGRDLCRQLERQLKQGLLDFIPEIEHWGMEEFFWHGLPGNPSHPIDQFLQAERDRFPAAARMQLARWKNAQIGCYEIGAVADDLVSLREVDVLTGRAVGPWVRAIALNIGGVNIYGPEKGKLNLTYLAPWAPDENIFCVMGYGLFLPREQLATVALLVSGLRSIQAVTFPLPWRAGKVAARQCFEQWRERDWFQFMATHVRCPFAAALMANEGPELSTIHRLITQSTAEARHDGLYFAMDDKAKLACGATAIFPLDFDSPNAIAFAEYREFRRIAGPPPAARGRV
ncbi:MAG TPA: hypothetical protein VGP68_08190 [Gemmataceae bacterium]|jgi:hypothetical protein|nr:hypothetical protein [Gemmataceae bacterium]